MTKVESDITNRSLSSVWDPDSRVNFQNSSSPSLFIILSPVGWQVKAQRQGSQTLEGLSSLIGSKWSLPYLRGEAHPLLPATDFTVHQSSFMFFISCPLKAFKALCNTNQTVHFHSNNPVIIRQSAKITMTWIVAAVWKQFCPHPFLCCLNTQLTQTSFPNKWIQV